MTLRNIYFGPVQNASGARGFFGEGYPFHKYFRYLGLTFKGATFVAKTTTLAPRPGNMALRDDNITPRKWHPDCIVVKPISGVVLNAVGLSGPGLAWLLEQGRWQKRREPFFLSFMAVGESTELKLQELRSFTCKLNQSKGDFQVPFGIELNYSCPNVKASYDDLIEEIWQGLTIASELGVPLVPKINALLPPHEACRIAQHEHCDAIAVSNTIPYGQLPEEIPWKKLFGSRSPLAKYGGGGLSGKPLFPVVRNWVRKARRLGFTKPIIAGGGVLSPDQAEGMFLAGANAVSLGTIAILRPWKMSKTIEFTRGLLRS